MVWSLCLACKECRFAKGMFQQENQGMGNKVQFYTALFARIWEYRAEAVLSKVELEYVHCGAFPK